MTWLQGNDSDYTKALGVNCGGVVVGYSYMDGSDVSHAFVYHSASTDPQMVDLATDIADRVGGTALNGAVLTSAAAITNDGRIAGQLVDSEGQEGVFVWNDNDSGLETLFCNDLAGIDENAVERMWIADINQNGVVLGGFDRPDKQGRSCFVWSPGSAPIVIRNLASPDGPYDTPASLYSPESISDNLTIVGRYPVGNSTQVFSWQLPDYVVPGDKVFATPDLLPGKVRYVSGQIGINNSGVIAASYISKGSPRPARHDLNPDSSWEVLPANHKQLGFSEAINQQGHICGDLWVNNAFDRGTGFVFLGDTKDPLKGFWSLDDLVDDDLWTAGDWDDDDVPLDISDADNTGFGTIVGYKLMGPDISPLKESEVRGFVLTPVSASAALQSVPEPSTLVLVILGAASLLGYFRPWRACPASLD